MGTTAAAIGWVSLLVVTALLSGLVGAGVCSYNSSDAAGNGLTRAFTVLAAILLWILLGVSLAVCGARGGLSTPSMIVAGVAFLAALSAEVAALSILDRLPPHHGWETMLRVVVVVSPWLVLFHAGIAGSTGLRAAYTSSPLQWLAPAALVLLSILPWTVWGPYKAGAQKQREAVVAAAQAEHEKRVRISELPDDTPLEAVLQYTAGPGMFTTDPPEEARRRIRKLPDRQAQAEALLEKGNDLLLVQLNTLDLTVTPELCRLARRNLQQLAAKWETEDPGSQVDYFLGPIRFLLARGCRCEPEIDALTKALARHPDSFEKKMFLDRSSAYRRGEWE